MAEICENSKKFKVIKLNYAEAIICFRNPTPVCDSCLNPFFSYGYYIAVLNRFYCPDCYRKWLKRAKNYKEDAAVENYNFEYYAEKLKLMRKDGTKCKTSVQNL